MVSACKKEKKKEKKKGGYVVSIAVSVCGGYQSPRGYNNMWISWGRVRLVKCTVSWTRVSKTRCSILKARYSASASGSGLAGIIYVCIATKPLVKTFFFLFSFSQISQTRHRLTVETQINSLPIPDLVRLSGLNGKKAKSVFVLFYFADLFLLPSY